MATLAELVADLQFVMQDFSTEVMTSARAKYLINLALKQISRETGAFKGTDSTVVSVPTTGIDVPDDYLRIDSIKVATATGKNIVYTQQTAEQYDVLEFSDNSFIYYIDNDGKIYFNHTLNAGDIVKVRYSKLHDELVSDSDETYPFLNGYDEMIVSYAAYKMCNVNGEAQQAQINFAEYKRLIGEFSLKSNAASSVPVFIPAYRRY